MIGRIFYGPPDWIVAHTSAHSRRAFGFWNAAVAIALLPIFGRAVLYVSILSVIALVPNFTAETPVEEEDS